MKKIIAFALGIALSMNLLAAPKNSFKLFSQDNGAVLSGKVFDKEGPLPYATVAVYDKQEVLAGTIADEKGCYSFKTPAGEYTIKFSMLGYVEKEYTFVLVEGENFFEDVLLEEDEYMLNAAKVTDKVEIIEMKLDKLVMNVSQSAFAKGSNALELMKKAPGVTIDKDGNVKLNGKSVSVWIDGRPSYLDGKALEALLRSTNGESIEKFELMEHPSSKYDAAGQGGIINIKTKRNFLAGLNGSMGLNGAAMYFGPDSFPWDESFWMNLGYRTNKVNTFFNVYEGIYNTPVYIDNFTALKAENYTQRAVTLFDNRYTAYNVKFGADWFLNDKNTLGFIFFVPGSQNILDSRYSNTGQFIADEQISRSGANVNNHNNSIQYNANLNYTHIFDESRSAEITANADYYRNVTSDRNYQTDSTSLASDLDSFIRNSVKDLNSLKRYDIYSAKADYQTLVAGKYMLEAGAKWALSVNDNEGEEKFTYNWQAPETVMTDVLYREHVAAAYATIGGQLSPKISLKLGLRGEYTNTFGRWNAGEGGNSEVKRSYFDIFPTVFLAYVPSQNLMLSASYTRRIQRPSYDQLNPTNQYIDANTTTVGNPDLKPSYSNEVGLFATYKRHFSTSVGYTHIKDVATPNAEYNSETGSQRLVWKNFGTTQMVNAGANISALPIGKHFQLTTSVTGIYTRSTNRELAFDDSTFGVMAYADFSFLLDKDWKISLDGHASSPMNYGNMLIKGRFSSNFAVSKTMLDNRLTLNFQFNDIFRTNSSDMEMLDVYNTGASAIILQRIDSQKVQLGLTWSFGTAHQSKRRNVGNLEEMSRAAASKLGGSSN